MKKLTKLCLLPALCLLLLASALAQTAPADPLPTVPVGTIISYYGTTAPAGYFVCNGGSFSAATYPKLAALLGKSMLPDLRGYFIRGYDTSNEVDTNGAGRELGSVQGDAIRNMTGRVGISNWRFPELSTDGVFGIRTKSEMKTFAASTDKTILANFDFDASRVVPTADENRPKNVNLLYCIKHDEPETLPIPEKASTAEAVAGTDDEKYVTPAGVAAAIAAQPAPQPVTPDLRLGVETLWPMRYQGKQVYAKLVNFGQLPASGVRFTTHGILNIEWCQVSWDYSSVRKNDDPDLVTLGVVSTAPPAYNIQWRIFVNKNSIQAHPLNSINSNGDWSAIICVLYTKTTDSPLP